MTESRCECWQAVAGTLKWTPGKCPHCRSVEQLARAAVAALRATAVAHHCCTCEVHKPTLEAASGFATCRDGMCTANREVLARAEPVPLSEAEKIKQPPAPKPDAVRELVEAAKCAAKYRYNVEPDEICVALKRLLDAVTAVERQQAAQPVCLFCTNPLDQHDPYCPVMRSERRENALRSRCLSMESENNWLRTSKGWCSRHISEADFSTLEKQDAFQCNGCIAEERDALREKAAENEQVFLRTNAANGDLRMQVDRLEKELARQRSLGPATISGHIAPPLDEIEANKTKEPLGELLRAELSDWLERREIVGILLDTPKHHVDINSAKLPSCIKSVLTRWGAICVVDEAAIRRRGEQG